MTKKSDFLAAYAAGKEAVEGKDRYAAFLGGACGVVIGRIVERRYLLGRLEGFAVSVLAVVLLGLAFSFVGERVRRAIENTHGHS